LPDKGAEGKGRKHISILTLRRIGFLVAVALLVRVLVGFFVLSTAPDLPDAGIYERVAVNLLQGKGLIVDEANKIARMPGYPLFLAACFALFGRNAVGVMLVQSAIGALTCVLVLLLGGLLFDRKTGWLSGWICALYPSLVFMSGLVLSETLFILLMVLGICALVGMERERGYGAQITAGVSMGLATLVRASLLLFALIVVPVWIWCRVRASRRVRSIAVYLACFCGLMLPWVVRNYRVSGHFVATTLQVGRSLYEANSPYATGGPAMHLIDWEKEIGGKKFSEYELDAYFKRKAVRYIVNNPMRFVWLGLVKGARFWSPVPNAEEFRRLPYILVGLLTYCPVMVLAVVGIYESRRAFRLKELLLLPAVYFGLLHMVFVGSVRYRIPVMPLLFPFAGYALSRRLAGYEEKASK